MAKVHVTKKVKVSAVSKRLSSLESMVVALNGRVNEVLDKLLDQSRVTMAAFVGDRILLTLLQLSCMEDFPPLTKEKRVDIILRAVEKAVEDFSKEEREAEWDLGEPIREVMLKRDDPVIFPPQDATAATQDASTNTGNALLDRTLSKISDKLCAVQEPQKPSRPRAKPRKKRSK